MPGVSSEELLAKINAIDQELLELTGGDSWEQLGQAAAQAQVVEDFLGSVIEDITETREGIEDKVDDLVSAGEQFDELLGIPEVTELLEIPEVEEIIEGLPGGLKDATDVIEEIKGFREVSRTRPTLSRRSRAASRSSTNSFPFSSSVKV